MRAYRVADGQSWDTTALAIGMDVDNSNFAGGSLAFRSGNVGIGTITPGNKLSVESVQWNNS